MEKQAQVLDASVIIKWFVNENLKDKALEIRNKYAQDEILIIIPDICFVEIINALKYKKDHLEFLSEINKDLWNMNFKVEIVSEFLINKAISIAKEYDITIYDSLYIALAQFHGCPLITADKYLYKIPNAIPLEKT